MSKDAEHFTPREGNELVRDEIVRLDYQTFKNKSFFHCTLVYAGGIPPTLIECDLVENQFVFEGQALNTAQFLASLAQGGGEDLIKEMLGIK